MTIADMALYAYTHVAEEGGFDLADYPAVSAWLARVAAEPGHVPMNPAPEGQRFGRVNADESGYGFSSIEGTVEELGSVMKSDTSFVHQ